MPDEDSERKVVHLRVAANRRDWGDATITELTNELNQALEHGERIMIFVLQKDPSGNTTLKTQGFTRHNTKVSWLEVLAVLQIKLQQWYAQAFQ